MADYFRHWLSFAEKAPRAPKIFCVNWFRKDAAGRFIWPGFGDNIRVLEWMFGRCAGTADAQATAIGLLPRPAELNTAGLALSETDLSGLLEVQKEQWVAEAAQHAEFLRKFGDRIPAELTAQNKALVERLSLL
jgi:phosphoenolpyruvate carboxykinase (GTP)